MQITLIRHLPTEWNKQQKLQGRRDVELAPLTEASWQGVLQNRLLLDELAPFDEVLASTMKRTQQTAQIYGYPFTVEPLLDELDFGPFEGLSKEKLYEYCGKKWMDHPEELILGESVANLKRRIVLFLEKYRDRQNILAFGHGTWIRAAISYCYSGDINHMNKITVQNNECVILNFHV